MSRTHPKVPEKDETAVWYWYWVRTLTVAGQDGSDASEAHRVPVPARSSSARPCKVAHGPSRHEGHRLPVFLQSMAPGPGEGDCPATVNTRQSRSCRLIGDCCRRIIHGPEQLHKLLWPATGRLARNWETGPQLGDWPATVNTRTRAATRARGERAGFAGDARSPVRRRRSACGPVRRRGSASGARETLCDACV